MFKLAHVLPEECDKIIVNVKDAHEDTIEKDPAIVEVPKTPVLRDRFPASPLTRMSFRTRTVYSLPFSVANLWMINQGKILHVIYARR